MEKLTGACIIGQSGGPTAVINASAQGVIQTALKADCITRVLGAAHGIKGVLEDKLYDMSQEDPAELDLLQYTPSSALGSCRYKLADPDVDDTDYKRILEIFEKYNVRYFFYNGGNDSMDTCNKISKYMQKVGYECRIMGIIEIMGRHAGWLAGSAALASLTGCGPDLVYLPETDFDMDKFLADVKAVYEKTGKCMVAVSEGIHYADGTFVSEAKTSATDGFGHAQLGGLAAHLADTVKQATGAKVRGIELSLLQRCGAHLASKTDVKEAWQAGAAAVNAAVEGVTDKCTREGGYTCETSLEPLDIVANFEKKVPRKWINEAGNGVKQEFIDYVLPLIQGETDAPKENGLPRFAHLKKVLTTEM